jgi:hypothetical protein
MVVERHEKLMVLKVKNSFYYPPKIFLKSNLLLGHHFPEVDQSIPHSSQGSVDAAVGHCRDLLKAHVSIMTQDDHLTLVFGKLIKHVFNTIVALPFHHLCFGAIFSKVEHFKNVLVIIIPDGWGTLYLTEVVHTQIVANSQCPGKELPLLCIPATADGVNDPDKNILEDIFGKVLVLNKEVNGCVKFVLMTQYQCLQGVSITGHKRVDELVVRQLR